MSSKESSEYVSTSVADESQSFTERFKKSPILTLGTISGLGVVSYMLWGLRKRDPNRPKLSVYLIHTRLYAQCTLVGFIAIIAYREAYLKPQRKKQEAIAAGHGAPSTEQKHD